MRTAFHIFLGMCGAIAILPPVIIWTTIMAVLGVPSSVRSKLNHRALMTAADDDLGLDPLTRATAILYARRMRRVKVMLLVLTALAIGAFAAAMVALGTFSEADKCLDLGGGWDFKNDRCEQ